MFPNLEAEMARKKIKKGHLQKVLGVRYATIVDKTTGKTQFTLSEAFAIKRLLFPEYPIEYLFSKEVEAYGIPDHSACN